MPLWSLNKACLNFNASLTHMLIMTHFFILIGHEHDWYENDRILNGDSGIILIKKILNCWGSSHSKEVIGNIQIGKAESSYIIF